MFEKVKMYFHVRAYNKFVREGRANLAAQFIQALEQDPLSDKAKEYRVMRSIDRKSFVNIAFIKR